MTREPDVVSPFRMPDPPDITESEKESIRQIAGSTAWDALNKILDWQQKRIALESYNAVQNQAFYQGRVHGFAWARNVMEEAINRPIESGEIENAMRLNEKEANFFS